MEEVFDNREFNGHDHCTQNIIRGAIRHIFATERHRCISMQPTAPPVNSTHLQLVLYQNGFTIILIN
uniref:Uncharacterized protein n=1 Tax=Romanomermis culicivorax TaxID=13658 RepID=A0A915J376_ROMCU